MCENKKVDDGYFYRAADVDALLQAVRALVEAGNQAVTAMSAMNERSEALSLMEKFARLHFLLESSDKLKQAIAAVEAERDRLKVQNKRFRDALEEIAKMLIQLLKQPKPRCGRWTMELKIKQSKTADSRSCDYSKVSKQTLYESSIQHINDVRLGIQFFKNMLDDSAHFHDHDKLSDIDGFHKDFITGFKEHSWWDNHRKVNRHHLLESDGIPENVNLIDVLDMIVDCVMAGIGRTGTVYPLNISQEVLMKAFQNTVKILKDNVVVEVDDGKD